MTGFAGVAARRDAVRSRGQAMWQALAPSRVTVHRSSARMVQDEDSGRERQEFAVVARDMPAKLQGKGSRSVQVGDVEYEQATALMHLPATFRDLADGDLLELTAGEWAGSVYRVVEAVQGDGQTARRVPLEQADPSLLT